MPGPGGPAVLLLEMCKPQTGFKDIDNSKVKITSYYYLLVDLVQLNDDTEQRFILTHDCRCYEVHECAKRTVATP